MGGLHDEIFVYLNGSRLPGAAFWQGLARCGHPVRLHCPALDPGDVATLEAAGVTVEARPVPFAKIVARSRLVVSHGGLGFTGSALAAGLAHLLVPCDLEKELLARDVAALGLGARVEPAVAEPDAFAATLRAACADGALIARAHAASAGFRARLTRSVAATVADQAAAML